jgi:hypothetical protein
MTIKHLPYSEHIRRALSLLDHDQLLALAIDSGTPHGTMIKIASGETGNPRIDTVSKFWPLLPRECRRHALKEQK